MFYPLKVKPTDFSILQQYPDESILNNTKVNSLAKNNEFLEVFPPEIFFKGKEI